MWIVHTHFPHEFWHRPSAVRQRIRNTAIMAANRIAWEEWCVCVCVCVCVCDGKQEVKVVDTRMGISANNKYGDRGFIVGRAVGSGYCVRMHSTTRVRSQRHMK